MPTLAAIIAEAATIYPTSRSDANQALSLKRIHKRLFTKLGRDSNQFTVYEDFTVASQEAYNLPTGCKIHSIVNMVLQVEDTAGGGEYTDFPYRAQNEDNDYESYFTRGSTDSTYYLYEEGEPIAVADRSILVNYYKYNTAFDSSDLTVIPSLDLEFHDYLVYMLVAENAACGDNPDTELSDYWKREAEEYFWDVKRKMDGDLYSAPAHSNECKEMM